MKKRHLRRISQESCVLKGNFEKTFEKNLQLVLLEILFDFPNFLDFYEIAWTDFPPLTGFSENEISLLSSFYNKEYDVTRIVLYKFPIRNKLSKTTQHRQFLKQLILENTYTKLKPSKIHT
jgi:hypothetical protein